MNKGKIKHIPVNGCQAHNIENCKLCLAIRQQAAVKNMLDIPEWRNPVSIDLTFKLYDYIPSTGRSEFLTKERATQSARHLLRKINDLFCTRSQRRAGHWAINCMAVREQGYLTEHPAPGEAPFHYHILIECPNPETLAKIEKIVTEIWHKTHFGNKHIKVQPCWDDGKFYYNLKFRTKLVYLDAFDWEIWHLRQA